MPAVERGTLYLFYDAGLTAQRVGAQAVNRNKDGSLSWRMIFRDEQVLKEVCSPDRIVFRA